MRHSLSELKTGGIAPGSELLEGVCFLPGFLATGAVAAIAPDSSVARPALNVHVGRAVESHSR
jgi:hypothetical protein